ncbi:MAG: efflux RND transporter periplasmic adaptor subunit [Nitrospirae bacterium]|nr:efflux RND transporter periplasmic adaptor subunit [Candidatus Troglogloeales bacterium]
MKNIFILLLTLAGVAPLLLECNKKETLPAPAFVPSAEVGAYQLKITLNPDPPERGDNQISVMIFPKGKTEAIRPDNIEATAVMPAMATMSEMRSDVKLAWQKNGENTGRFLLGMDGTYFLDVHFTPPGKPPHQARFKLVTGVPTSAGLTFLTSSVLGEQAVNTSAPTGEVMISPTRLQSIGVKTTKVERHPLTKTIRMQGRVTYDERTRSEVALKFAGFIGEVFVEFVGKPVLQGIPLFTVYSPELSATMSEYLNLLAAAESHSGRWDSLITTARKKLLLWDMTSAQIDKIVQTGEVPQYIPILAPASGIVIEKDIVRGSPVTAGQVLYRLADLSSVWIEAQVYESELSLIEKGLPVKVVPIGLPGVTLNGSVSFISPSLNPESRTGAVRIEAKNPQLKLLPEMSVTVETKISLGEPLAGVAPLSVPKDAIIYSGDKKFVFIDQGGGRFIPRFINVGQKGDEGYEVVSGLSEGEMIVTSGNFFIAAESRLTAGLSTFLEGTTVPVDPPRPSEAVISPPPRRGP